MIRFLTALFMTFLASSALADDIKAIRVELNKTETLDQSCVLTFMITNTTTVPIDKAVYETVLFDADNTVNRLILFDFGTLPVDRPRVRQFAVTSLTCDNLGRVLFNGASTCEGADIDPATCDADLSLLSRVDVEVLG